MPKPLMYADNERRFAEWRDQIRHVVVRDLPDPAPTRWTPERFQRDAIVRGLDGVTANDIVLITDADEIPCPDVLRTLPTVVGSDAALEMRLCMYRANWERTEPWPLARAARASALTSPAGLRLDEPSTRIPQAGAHLSYMLDTGGIQRKYEWFAHSELDERRARSESHLAAMTMLGLVAWNGEALEVRQERDLGSVQRALLKRWPEIFDFRPRSAIGRQIGQAWGRARRRPAVPGWLVDGGDRSLAATARWLHRAPRRPRHRTGTRVADG